MSSTRRTPAPAEPAPMMRLESIQYAADRLCVSRPKLYELIDAGEVRSIRIGVKTRRIVSSSVDEYIQRQMDADQKEREETSPEPLRAVEA